MKSRIVAVGVIIKGDCILMGKKPDGVGPYPGKWLIPGGGINLGEESAKDALIREIREETTLEVQDIEEVGFDEDFTDDKHGEMTHYIYLIFRMRYLKGEIRAQDDLAFLEWVPISKLAEADLCKPSIRLFRKLGYI